jgi:AcrR family transcriptional regulator
MAKQERQTQSTAERLQQALTALIHEAGYDAITIQAIVDRAQVGRTTFYLHFRSKDDLFLSCHEAIVSQFHAEPHPAGAREDLLAADAPSGMVSAYAHLAEARSLLFPILRGKDGLAILRLMRERAAHAIEANLRTAFVEADCTLPLGVLANYLAGAQVALVQWWLEKRQPYAPDHLAQAYHRLQRAAIREAFRLGAPAAPADRPSRQRARGADRSGDARL